MKTIRAAPDVARYAAMLAAMGAEPRLRIVRLLLSAHPHGLVVGDIQAELGVPGSTLSHHLEKLRIAGLVKSRRERQFLWYMADSEALREVVGFLYEECCSRSKPVKIEKAGINK
jgi:ArsR family transcriptional regulator, arsenate/arsenite/antimonite-responsive transcriptional repressor